MCLKPNAITEDKLREDSYESQDQPKECLQNLRMGVVGCRTLAHYL